jgi:hypothetical protein
MDGYVVTNGGAAAHGDGGVFFGMSGGQLGRLVTPAGGGLLDGGFVGAGAGNLQAAAPVLGNGGLLYAVGGGGVLTVRRQSDLTEAWSGGLATASGVGGVAQMALDVYRDANGAKVCPLAAGRTLGMLYVLTKSGATATLHAIVVDSPGLDGTAPWPKYQRDNGNTGNANSDMSFWTCP